MARLSKLKPSSMVALEAGVSMGPMMSVESTEAAPGRVARSGTTGVSGCTGPVSESFPLKEEV